ELAKRITKPLLIDSKGLTAFFEDLEILRNRKGATILLPRLEEMSSITSQSRTEIDEHIVDITQVTAAHLNSIIVLKGTPSLIALPDRRVFINRNRISGIAPINSSAVLTNTIAGIYFQEVPLDEAVRHGVFICGLAGELTLQAKSDGGITTENILDYLPLAHKMFREGLSQEMEDPTIGIHPI
ncbi:MAG TPA: bifunctional ADP-dependent NAD(P)H-hydrate dehydratase/NAD(P)H-hydrate epimerase, partial [Anaerolineae bacterium]|nr:bifunctional ADP-dependent NAD(P)H-hydrate dehydratase/NAD(P)H-hydrate epimerase [Anaerolineae bacterium]